MTWCIIILMEEAMLSVEDFLDELHKESVPYNRRKLQTLAEKGLIPQPAYVGGHRSHYPLSLIEEIKKIRAWNFELGFSLNKIVKIRKEKPGLYIEMSRVMVDGGYLWEGVGEVERGLDNTDRN